jgi:hypothetical protein
MRWTQGVKGRRGTLSRLFGTLGKKAGKPRTCRSAGGEMFFNKSGKAVRLSTRQDDPGLGTDVTSLTERGKRRRSPP